MDWSSRATGNLPVRIPLVTLGQKLMRSRLIPAAVLTLNGTAHEARQIPYKRSSALLSKHTGPSLMEIVHCLRPLDVTRVTSTTLSRYRKEPRNFYHQWRMRFSSDKLTGSRGFLRLSANFTASRGWLDWYLRRQ